MVWNSKSVAGRVALACATLLAVAVMALTGPVASAPLPAAQTDH